MAAPVVHPSALVDPAAELGEDVVVGPFAVVEGGVVVGAGALLEVGAVLRRGTEVGAHARVGPYAVIGSPPMDTRFRGEPSGVTLGARCDLREHVTVHRATGEGARTTVGADALVMTGAHVSHNAVVGDGAVLTTQVQLGGHVEVGAGAVLGAGVMVHQWGRVGRWAMVGATSALNADVLPFALARGNPARHYRLNAVGLRRRALAPEVTGALQDALRAVRRHDRARLEELAGRWPEVAELTAFVERSRLGVARFVTHG
jgi:UDP-N-acetylglucosamine acyltransferase